jgi:hypothetical protein
VTKRKADRKREYQRLQAQLYEAKRQAILHGPTHGVSTSGIPYIKVRNVSLPRVGGYDGQSS